MLASLEHFSFNKLVKFSLSGNICPDIVFCKKCWRINKVQKWKQELVFELINGSCITLIVAGDFSANKMLFSWACIGGRMLERLSEKLTNLHTLVIDFPAAADLVQSIVESCPKLQNLTLELRGHNCDAGNEDYRIYTIVVGIFHFIDNKPIIVFISRTGEFSGCCQ